MNINIMSISGPEDLTVKSLIYLASAERLPIYASGTSIKSELYKRSLLFQDFDKIFLEESKDSKNFLPSVYNLLLIFSSDSDWYSARRTTTRRNKLFNYLTAQLRPRGVLLVYNIPDNFKVDKRLLRSTQRKVKLKVLESRALTIKVTDIFCKGYYRV